MGNYTQIRSVSVEGVLVLTAEHPTARLALFSGRPEITKEGCLLIGARMVVWSPKLLAETVPGIISGLRSNSPMEDIQVGGSSLSDRVAGDLALELPPDCRGHRVWLAWGEYKPPGR